MKSISMICMKICGQIKIFSEYNSDFKYFDTSNIKTIDKFKDETKGKPITEFVWIKG
jgi:hypothetical protein